MEAAAEQRYTAALACERAELDKQARSLSCARGAGLPCLSALYGDRVCESM